MKFLKRIAVVFLIIMMLPSFNVFADKNYDYTLNGSEKVIIPKTYIYSKSISIISGLNDSQNKYFEQPTSLSLDNNGNIFVVDSGNNRIVKMTQSGELISLYESAGNKSFNQPSDIFVNSDGSFCVSDTNNGRIVLLGEDGTLIKEFGKPNGDALSSVSVYTPTCIATASNNGLYILMGENLMSVDAENNFKGYIGQTDIGFNFTDWLLRKVASDEQKKLIKKRTASNYINFCLGTEGIIYATSYDTAEGEIKALNSVGNNIFRKYGTVDGNVNAFKTLLNRFFSGNIISKRFRYGEVCDGTMPTLTAVTVDKNGIVTVIEKENGKLYQYDNNGNLLTVFGGLGAEKGKFAIPSDLTVDEFGNIYVLDKSYGNIQIFEPTDFIKNVQKATVSYNSGDYDEAEKQWKDVLKTDSQYPLAHYGIGMTEYKSGNYKKAMDEFSSSNYRSEYSKAFKKYRYEIMQNNFLLIVLIGLGVVICIILLIRLLIHKSGDVLYKFEYLKIGNLSVTNGLWLGISACFHPFGTITSIKGAKKRLNMVSVVIFIFAIIICRILFIFTVHYPLQDVEIYNVNIVEEIVKLLMPLFTWTISVYLITSQVNGEATFAETLTANVYCMVPYIFVIPFASAISGMLSVNEKMLFAVLVNGVVLWSVILLIRTVMILNDYTVIRTIFICLFSVVVMVLVWFAIILGYTLFERIVEFVKNIIVEAMLIS